MRFLSNKEKKQLVDKLPKGYSIDKKDEITEKDSILFRNKEKFLIIQNGEYLPHMKSVDMDSLKSVYVDHGAIPHVAKGANIMRPGITKIDEGIAQSEIILVREEVQGKLLAIGFSSFTSEDMEKASSGKAVTVYHFIGDEYY